jgi:hypothetical protein
MEESFPATAGANKRTEQRGAVSMFGLLRSRQWSIYLSPLFRLYRLEESSPKSGR